MKRALEEQEEEEPKKTKPTKPSIKGLLTTLIIAHKVGNGFRVIREFTFTGCALASYFPVLHGNAKGDDVVKGIHENANFVSVGLARYLQQHYGVPMIVGDKTRFASYMYNLEAPGSYCIFVWDFADVESALLMDNYFAQRPRSDLCGDYIYGKLYHTLPEAERAKFKDVFEF